jgi:hypothetical protein
MTAKKYLIADTIFSSEVDFSGLLEGIGGVDVEFERCEQVEPSLPEEIEWYHEWYDEQDDEQWLQFGRVRDSHGVRQYALLFTHLVLFLLDADFRKVRCYPFPETSDSTIQHLFLDQVIPIVLSAKRKGLVLHASGVRLEDRCVALVGSSGVGKSTLAGILCQNGLQFLSDDFVVIRESENCFEAVPSYPSLRVWDDTQRLLSVSSRYVDEVAHYSSKRRISIGTGLGTFSATPVALAAILLPEFVGRDEDVELVRLHGGGLVPKLGQYSFHLDSKNEDWQAQEFCLLAKLVERVPLYCLRVPKNLGCTDKVAAMILHKLMNREL